MRSATAQNLSSPVHRVAARALLFGLVIMLLKFGVFFLTRSVAVLSDALESIINVAAAAFMLYSVWLSSRPADEDHPYGHGKVEFMTLGLEGWLILTAGVSIGVFAVYRLFTGTGPGAEQLGRGVWWLLGVNVANAVLAFYVYSQGKKLDSPVLIGDGKHLFVDVASTFGVFIGLIFVKATGEPRLDPIVAIIMAMLILLTSWKLLWQSIDGLMDRNDPEDNKAISALLDEEVQKGAICSYHKVRHRHMGTFHWVDLHIQVDPELTVRQSHDLASRIEYRIEKLLDRAKATAHVEPYNGELETVTVDDPAPQPPQNPPEGQGSAADDTTPAPTSPKPIF